MCQRHIWKSFLKSNSITTIILNKDFNEKIPNYLIAFSANFFLFSVLYISRIKCVYDKCLLLYTQHLSLLCNRIYKYLNKDKHIHMQMNKMSHFIFHWYLLFLLNNIAYSYCPDDADLQRHNCICNLENNFIKCSSLPNQCRTCYRYNEIHFNDNVHALPIEAFRFYKFFDNQKKSSFKIEFAQINTLVSNSFSKLNISQDQRLEIKIFKYASSKLPTKVFEDIEIQTKSKLNIEILDVTSNVLTIEQHAFNGIKFHYKSLFRLTILRAKDTIQFESNAGKVFFSFESIF